MDPMTLVLLGLAALFAVLAAAGAMAARGARGEIAALRAAGEAARAEAQVAQARIEAEARVVADRDGLLSALRQDIEGLRQSHREAEGRCAEAETRCAKANEAVERLEAAGQRLREDHAESVRVLREEAARTLEAVRAEGQRTAERLRAVEEEFGRQSVAHAALQKERDERLASAERERARLVELREDMGKEFRDLAQAALRTTGSEFSKAHEEKLHALLNPFREQVQKFEAELRAVHQEADKDRAILAEQIRAVAAQAQEVSRDAANLAQALKGDKQRQGAWGEAQLARYLELMGYRQGIDYETQSSRTGEEGDRLRPDVILNLPGGKSLIIDSKVSLSAYADAIDAETEEERERCLKLHARNVRARVDELAVRDYHRHVDGSTDWVLLFMPIEGAVSAAWRYDAEIAAYAMDRGVALAYPTTLLATLRMVRFLWDVEKRNRNAEQIAERAGRLYDKLAGFLDSFQRVGSAIDDARKAHDKAWGQLSRGNGNLLGQVEKLKELGARTGKSLGVAHDGEEGTQEALPEAANDPAPLAIPAAE